MNLIKLQAAQRSPPASPKGERIRAGSPGPGAAGGGSSPLSSPRQQRSAHFRHMYDRGDLPCLVDQARPGQNSVKWKAALSEIDLHLYLPVFLDGLLETQVGAEARSQQSWHHAVGMV